MKPLAIDQLKSNQNAKSCYICKYKHVINKNYFKVRNYFHYTEEYRGAAHSICNLKYCEPKETSIVFHNGCNYHYHFIIKELTEEF